MELLFQLQPVLERFADTLGYFVVAVSVRVKGDGIYQRHIDFAIYHNALVCGDADDLANHAAAIFTVLIFNKLTFETQWKLIDNRGVHGFGFTGGQPAACKLVCGPVSRLQTEIIRLDQVGGICDTDGESAQCLDIFTVL